MDQLPTELPDYVKADIAPQVGQALTEDIGTGDITALLVAEESRATATIVTREPAVLCGVAWLEEVFRQIDPEVRIDWHHRDGDSLSADEPLCSLHGRSRSILTGERTALNFLQTLSATATRSRAFAEAAARAGNIHVLDTRKTIPGLRTAQKYAVLCGGCGNHRLGLYDQFLIKENHILACGSVGQAINKARDLAPEKWLVIEVESLEELRQAVAAKPDRVMLDDFTDDSLREALTLIPEDLEVEISGNVDLQHLQSLSIQRPVCISSGALTKHIQAVDLSMRFADE